MTKNRSIKASKGIPLENMVFDEIPFEKAISIGHIETGDKTGRDADKKDR